MKIRRIIFWAHLLAGVVAGLIILVMSLTGICLAFQPRLINWAERDSIRVTPPAGARSRLDLGVLLTRAREEFPGMEPSALTMSADPAVSLLVNLGRENVAYLNPYTGEIIGHGSGVRDWLQKIEGWHRWLGVHFDHRAIARNITGATTMLFLLLALSGIFLWWPRSWNWRALRPSVWFVGGLRGKARDWNWHNAVGLWCGPVLIMLTLTGTIMSYQWANGLLYKVTGNQPPPAAQSNQNREEEGRNAHAGKSEKKMPPSINYDSLLATIRHQVPDWKTVTLRLPQRITGPVTALTRQSNSDPSFVRSQLTLDSRTGEIIKWEPYSELNAGRKLRLWARSLHTGEAGGLLGQLVVALVCIGGCVLVFTGFSMVVRRFVGRQSSPASI